MPKLKHLGERDWRGLDPAADPPRDLIIPAGAELEVPEALAERLLADFPARFRPTPRKPGPKPKEATP